MKSLNRFLETIKFWLSILKEKVYAFKLNKTFVGILKIDQFGLK